MGEIYGWHSNRKGRKSKQSHKRIMFAFFFYIFLKKKKNLRKGKMK